MTDYRENLEKWKRKAKEEENIKERKLTGIFGAKIKAETPKPARKPTVKKGKLPKPP